ncbi:MAG: LysM peptidoglycan-binding domain-containing protein [Desulfobacteraceae bacterium]|nr:MAG: LysM peptidoglycan-binding domain-containing protein [Desulfobacteraceae bacterium]
MKFDDPMKDDSMEEKKDENYFDGMEHSSLMKKRSGFNFSGATGMTVLLYLAGGIAVAVLVGLIALKSGKSFDPDRITGMDARIKQMEDRIIDLSLFETKLVGLETQGEKLDQLTTRVYTLESNLATILERMESRSPEPKKQAEKSVPKSVAEMPQKTVAEKKQPQKIVAEKKQPSSKGPEIYHHVRQGDTLYSISRKYDLSVAELTQLNPSLSGKKTIFPGQKLRIQKKR